MPQHVYARLSGYGITLVPLPDFVIERIGDTDLPLRLSVGPHTTLLSSTNHPGSIRDLADISPGPNHPHWLIETSLFVGIWPTGFAVHYDSSPPGYYLLAADGAMAFPQGPFDQVAIPPLQRMVGPGQELVSLQPLGSIQWVHLRYQHDGAPWIQRHYVVTLLSERRVVVTLQAPLASESRVLQSVEALVRSIATPSTAA